MRELLAVETDRRATCYTLPLAVNRGCIAEVDERVQVDEVGTAWLGTIHLVGSRLGAHAIANNRQLVFVQNTADDLARYLLFATRHWKQ